MQTNQVTAESAEAEGDALLCDWCAQPATRTVFDPHGYVDEVLCEDHMDEHAGSWATF